MSHKMLRPFIVKVYVLGYFLLSCIVNKFEDIILIIAINLTLMYFNSTKKCYSN